MSKDKQKFNVSIKPSSIPEEEKKRALFDVFDILINQKRNETNKKRDEK